MPQRDTPLTKLRRKRIRIHRALDKLEPLLAGYREKLARVEAEIQQLALELPLPTRHRCRASPWRSCGKPGSRCRCG